MYLRHLLARSLLIKEKVTCDLNPDRHHQLVLDLGVSTVHPRRVTLFCSICSGGGETS